ncbi:hypothetical protein [Fusobacterium necrophorum]|uniref:hypothetical protein n=1 Tax=Fusobacterium necrophorum TaxID=859 RepID=UPI00370F0A35
MIIEVTEEEMQLIENFRKKKKDEEVFKICLKNYGEALVSLKEAVINLEDFLQNDEFYDEFGKKYDEGTFDDFLDIVKELD